jgi:L-cysteine desulfidase
MALLSKFAVMRQTIIERKKAEMLSRQIVDTYIDILREELVPAMGCTEPIAVAYAGALARKTLGTLPDTVELAVSRNIIKNVKSVIVPHTKGRKGLQTAVAIGICCGNAEKELEVLSDITDEQLTLMDDFLKSVKITVSELTSNCPFDIQVKVFAGADSAYIRIIGNHTNVVCIHKNDEILLDKPFTDEVIQAAQNRKLLNVRDIVEFADTVRIDDIREVLKRQAGMSGRYGANIGKILIRSYGNSVQNRAKAYAAAGSDARMNGCELPVVINSGSGNQGMTASIPVIVYAKECNVSEDLLYRALAVSNLVTIHLKTGIGSLSAYCGATSAGAGAGAGICYLYGGHYDEIAHTIVNALAINSGMLCDGAKASCAAKIASAVEAGLLGMQMYMHDSQFYSGEGIVANDVEKTIDTVSAIAREGMRETDNEIIHFMIEND